MSTSTIVETKAPAKPRTLVDMNWDPLTRIVGSLGIYTKIDFANKEVAECYSTSSIFRGYSIFMKGHSRASGQRRSRARWTSATSRRRARASRSICRRRR